MMYGYVMCTWYIMVTSTVYHVPKCMRCHKAIVVITGRSHCFHGCIYITPSCLCEIWALCVSWLDFCYFFIVIVTVILIFVIMVIITITFTIRWLLLLTHHCYFCYHILLEILQINNISFNDAYSSLLIHAYSYLFYGRINFFLFCLTDLLKICLTVLLKW